MTTPNAKYFPCHCGDITQQLECPQHPRSPSPDMDFETAAKAFYYACKEARGASLRCLDAYAPLIAAHYSALTRAREEERTKLRKLYDQVKSMPVRIEPMSGQRLSYVEKDDVLAGIECLIKSPTRDDDRCIKPE